MRSRSSKQFQIQLETLCTFYTHGTFHYGHSLASMSMILSHRVTVEVPYDLHLVCLAINLHLIRLHYLLNLFPHVTQPYINVRSLYFWGGVKVQRLKFRG